MLLRGSAHQCAGALVVLHGAVTADLEPDPLACRLRLDTPGRREGTDEDQSAPSLGVRGRLANLDLIDPDVGHLYPQALSVPGHADGARCLCVPHCVRHQLAEQQLDVLEHGRGQRQPPRFGQLGESVPRCRDLARDRQDPEGIRTTRIRLESKDRHGKAFRGAASATTDALSGERPGDISTKPRPSPADHGTIDAPKTHPCCKPSHELRC